MGMTSTQWAALLAPFIGVLFWWLVMYPGRKLSDFLWKRLPDGKLRSILLRSVGGSGKQVRKRAQSPR